MTDFTPHPYENVLNSQAIEAPGWDWASDPNWNHLEHEASDEGPPRPKMTKPAIAPFGQDVKQLLAHIGGSATSADYSSELRQGLDELDEILDYWILAAERTNSAFQTEANRFSILFAAGRYQRNFAGDFFRYLDRNIPESEDERRYAALRRLLETYGGELADSLRTLGSDRRKILRVLTLDAEMLNAYAGFLDYRDLDEEQLKKAAQEIEISPTYFREIMEVVEGELQMFERSIADLIEAQQVLRSFIRDRYDLGGAPIVYNVKAHNIGIVGSHGTVRNVNMGLGAGEVDPT